MSEEQQPVPIPELTVRQIADATRCRLLQAAKHLRDLGYPGKATWCETEAGKMLTRGETLSKRAAKAAKHEATAGEREIRRAAKVAKLEAELVKLRE